MGKILTDVALRFYANVAELKKGAKEATTAVKGYANKAKNSTKAAASSFSKMSKNVGGNLSKVTGGLNSLGPAASGAVGGISALATGVKGLIAAMGPFALIIVAIGIALKAVMSYFKGTVEGGDKLAKIMGYIQGIGIALNDAFIELGDVLVKAFEDPQQAVADLWEAIKTNLLNRWQGTLDFFTASFGVLKNGLYGLGQSIKGIFGNEEAKAKAEEFFSASVEGLKDVGRAWIQATTGFDTEQQDKIINKVVELGKKTKNVAEANASLSVRQRQLDKDKIALLESEAKAQKKIADLVYISSDKINASYDERLLALTEAKKVQAELGAEQRRVAKEEYDILVAKNALGNSSLEDIKKEKELKVLILGIDTQTLNKQRELQNRIEEAENARIAGIKKIKDAQTSLTKSVADSVDSFKDKSLQSNREVAASLRQLMSNMAGENPDLFNIKEQKIQLANLESDMKAFAAKKAEIEMKSAALSKRLAIEQTQTGTTEGDNRVAATIKEMAENQKAHASLNEKLLEMDTELAVGKNQLRLAQSDLDKANAEEIINNAMTVASAISNIGSQLSSLYAANKAKELKAVEGNAKKTEAVNKKYAKKEKAIALAQAGINTALAVTKALTGAVPPLNLVLAGLAAVAGGVQIAAIASTSFAQGGIVSGPTNALIGEYPGAKSNPEVVAPLNKLKDLLGTNTGKVVFKIDYDQLVGVLDNGAQLKTAY